MVMCSIEVYFFTHKELKYLSDHDTSRAAGEW